MLKQCKNEHFKRVSLFVFNTRGICQASELVSRWKSELRCMKITDTQLHKSWARGLFPALIYMLCKILKVGNVVWIWSCDKWKCNRIKDGRFSSAMLRELVQFQRRLHSGLMLLERHFILQRRQKQQHWIWGKLRRQIIISCLPKQTVVCLWAMVAWSI